MYHKNKIGNDTSKDFKGFLQLLFLIMEIINAHFNKDKRLFKVIFKSKLKYLKESKSYHPKKFMSIIWYIISQSCVQNVP